MPVEPSGGSRLTDYFDSAKISSKLSNTKLRLKPGASIKLEFCEFQSAPRRLPHGRIRAPAIE